MNRLRRLAYRLSSSFWFLPALLVTGAIALALAAIEADARYVVAGALDAWPRLFGAGASASRSLLTAVAGSMITVAGTVFSITLVALSLASTQYSSRVLRNFMRDRTNQAVLGVFLGIFAYCLVVLRAIHGHDDDAFVPSVAVLLGLLLGFGGIGVLVYFIHHIAQSVQASRIIDSIRAETAASIDRLFPSAAGDAAAVPACMPSPLHEVRRCDRAGYVQFIDYPQLCRLAREAKLQLHVHCAVGQHVLPGDRLLSASGLVPDGLGDAVADCWAIGTQRTLEQDVGFGLRQLVDVALKALSPGSNDVTTAIMCIDALSALLVQLSERALVFEGCGPDGAAPHPLVAEPPHFSGFLAQAHDEIRHAARDQPKVLLRLLDALTALEVRVRVPDRRASLREQVLRLREAAERDLRDARDRAAITAAAADLLERLPAPG